MNKNFIIYLKNNFAILFLIFIILVGSFLRLKGLTHQSYWIDEVFSADFCNPNRSLQDMLYLTLTNQHTPIYNTLLWSFFKIFGYTEFTGRLLSALIGILCIPAIYNLGKELFNKQIGIYASLLTAMNYYLILYSQEVRDYILFFLMSTLSYLFFNRVINNLRKKDFFLYLLSTILLIYTHYFSFFLVLSQGFIFLFYIYKFSQKRKKLIIFAILTIIVLAIFFLPLLKYLLNIGEGAPSWIHRPSWYYIFILIFDYFHSPYKIFLILFLLISLISLKYLLDKNLNTKERYALSLLFVWIMIGYLIPYVLSISITPLLVHRYMIYLLPALILTFSYGLWKLNFKIRYILIILTVFFCLFDLYDSSYFKIHNKNYYYHIMKKSKMRYIIQQVASYNQLPIYNAMTYDRYNHGNTNFYQVYANLLKINLKIYGYRKLIKDLKNKNLPQCFWVLDAHKLIHLDELNISKNSSLIKALEIKKLRAEGILFVNNVKPDICIKKLHNKEQ